MRARDDGVTDIELPHPWDGRDRLDVVVVESVAGVDLQPQQQPPLDGRADPRQLDLARSAGVRASA